MPELNEAILAKPLTKTPVVGDKLTIDLYHPPKCGRDPDAPPLEEGIDLGTIEVEVKSVCQSRRAGRLENNCK